MKKLEGTGLLAQITNLVSQEILRIAKLHDPAEADRRYRVVDVHALCEHVRRTGDS